MDLWVFCSMRDCCNDCAINASANEKPTEDWLRCMTTSHEQFRLRQRPTALESSTIWSNDWLQLQVGSQESTDQQDADNGDKYISFKQGLWSMNTHSLQCIHYGIITWISYRGPISYHYTSLLKKLVRSFFNKQHVNRESSVCENLPRIIHNSNRIGVGFK